MIQYVKLFTPSDYSPPQGGGKIVLIVVLVIAALAFLSGIAFICDGERTLEKEKVAFSEDSEIDRTIGTGLIAFAIILSMAAGLFCCLVLYGYNQYTGTRKGDMTEDNIALVERSYGIHDMKTESKNGESVEDYLTTENNPADIQYLKVVAQSDGGGSIRRLTMQINKSNRLRVYEGTGDAQHLITPAQKQEDRNP